VKRGLVLIAFATLVLSAAPAEAKKKHPKKPGLGPVVTATANRTGRRNSGRLLGRIRQLSQHTDSRIAGGGFIDTAVNGGSVTGQMTVQSQAMCF
jgi:hypothetical protein